MNYNNNKDRESGVTPPQNNMGTSQFPRVPSGNTSQIPGVPSGNTTQFPRVVPENAKKVKPTVVKKANNSIRLPYPLQIGIVILIAALLCTGFFFFGKSCGTTIEQQVTQLIEVDPAWEKPDYVVYEPIVKNEYSRPGTYLSQVNSLVVHYVANPGTSAAQNRSYFNGLAESKITYASSHFIVGLEGEILQLMPLDEIAYASNERNKDSISIECCHPDETGKYNEMTYNSLIKLLADLCREYELDPLSDIIRHYDVTGKMCPKYYVENEGDWNRLITDVAAELTE